MDAHHNPAIATTACMVYAVYPINTIDYQKGAVQQHNTTTYIRTQADRAAEDSDAICCCHLI
jgi:hypothetical protein